MTWCLDLTDTCIAGLFHAVLDILVSVHRADIHFVIGGQGVCSLVCIRHHVLSRRCGSGHIRCGACVFDRPLRSIYQGCNSRSAQVLLDWRHLAALAPNDNPSGCCSMDLSPVRSILPKLLCLQVRSCISSDNGLGFSPVF